MDVREQISNREAENAFIGALIEDGSKISELDVEVHDFYFTKNATIYSAMKSVHEEGKHLDFITLSDELRGSGKFDEVGGSDALLNLALTYGANCVHVEIYARIIKRLSVRRRALGEAQKLATAAMNPEVNIEEVLASAADIFAKSGNTEGGAEHVSGVMNELLDDLEEAYKNPTDYFGIVSGMSGFDKHTGGLQRGELTVIAGEPGVGKSSFAMQLCVGMARGAYGIAGTPGVVYQLEMSKKATMRRVIALHSRVQSRNIRSGKFSGEEARNIIQATAKVAELPIFISDRTDWTTSGLRADLARIKARHNIGWVLIDYMGLLKDAPELKEHERSAIVSTRVHDIAKDLDLAVLSVHDMTKAGMTGQIAGQASLAGSRKVLYNADQIISLRVPNTDEPNILRLEWLKFREDSSNRYIELERVNGQAAFSEVEKGF